MSPEQVRSSRNVDARADVWSLGVIFYELVSGRPAFGGNTVTHITAQVLEGTPFALSSLVAGLPPTVDGVVQKALAKNPDERFVDVAALASALEPFAGPSGVGYADRAARILRGALRPDAALIFTAEDSKPALRDDALGGTRRFDRTARVKRARLAVGFLALLAVVLVWTALDAYRGSARAAPARAEAHLARAFRIMSGFARLSAERARVKPSTAASSEATAISDLAPAASGPGHSAPGVPPTIPSGKVSRPPAISGAPKPAPGLAASSGPPSNVGPAQPFNPYAERN
jgi:serine/threonine-protein kinase